MISTLFARCMRTLFTLVRCCDPIPVDWVSAQACPLDKKNGKEGCEEVRLIDIVEEMSNSFVDTLLERDIRGRSARPYASGYQHGRSRLEAIIHQRVIAHRARVAGRNIAVSSTINKMHVWVLGFAVETCASVNKLIEMLELFFTVPMENLCSNLDVELFREPQGQWTFFKIDVYHPAVDSWLQLV